MGLFQLGSFSLHSGEQSKFFIDCAALTDEDIKAIAYMIVESLFRKGLQFSSVVGIPEGGLRLAKALQFYSIPIPKHPVLIVDDVLTTGSSMELARLEQMSLYRASPIGAVIFARGKCPDWVMPLFQM